MAEFGEVDEQRPSDPGPDAGHGLEQLGEFGAFRVLEQRLLDLPIEVPDVLIE